MQQMASISEHEFDRTGGSVATDYANTLSGSRVEPGTEHLARYADLVEFARQTGVLTDVAAKRLLASASRRPEKATQTYRRAIALREAMWRVFDRIARAREAEARDLALISAEAAEALRNARVTSHEGGYAWRWEDADDLARPLWPIARAAADLVTSDDARARLRECASDSCGWVFVDRTKNRSRRWCDMNGCGNRAKVRAFRERQKRTSRKPR